MEKNMILHEAMNGEELTLMPVSGGYIENPFNPVLFFDDEDEGEEDIDEDEGFDDMDDEFEDEFEDDDFDDDEDEYEDEEDDFDYEEDVDYDDFDE
jgi:hypothetical protein